MNCDKEFIKKLKEIESLNNKLYDKVKELNNVNREVDTLRPQGLKAKRFLNILRKLREAMAFKGYISDKEFEQIIKEDQDQYQVSLV